MRVFIMASLLILLTSCASTNYYEKTIDSWRGNQGKDLIASWGQPDQIIRSKDGSETMIYLTKKPPYFDNITYQTNVFVVGNKAIGVQVPRNQPKTTMIGCTTSFTLNTQNTITDARFEGSGCMGRAATQK